MFSLGKSKESRELWALELSNNPGATEAKPNARYIGNMHGDEPASRCYHTSASLLHFVCTSFVASWFHHMVMCVLTGNSTASTCIHSLLCAWHHVSTSVQCCRQLLLGLAEWMCQYHATDSRAADIVNGMHLYLVPTVNPDGFDLRQRHNV